MTSSEATRRESHNAEIARRLREEKFVPCYIGRGAAIHAAVSTTKNLNGFVFPRPLCQPHSSTFFASLLGEGTEVTCKRCLASLASHPFTKGL